MGPRKEKRKKEGIKKLLPRRETPVIPTTQPKSQVPDHAKKYGEILLNVHGLFVVKKEE